MPPIAVLCPNCVRRPVDPTTKTGWCGQCDANKHADELADKQRWWRLHGRKTRGQVELGSANLQELEGVIRGGLQRFLDVGACLAEIRDRKLYLDLRFTSFEGYCRDRWGIGRVYAHYQIQAAKFVQELCTVAPDADAFTLVNTALTERVVRELLRLEPAQARELWEEIVGTYPARLITANLVAAEVAKRVQVQPAPPAPLRARQLRSLADQLEANGLPEDEELLAELERIVEAAARLLAGRGAA